MLLVKELLCLVAVATYSLGSEVVLDLSNAGSDNFDVVNLDNGKTLTTRITPRPGVYVSGVSDKLDNVWSPLSKNYTFKSFEIHQRSGHDELGHLVVTEPNRRSLQEAQEAEEDSENKSYDQLYYNDSKLCNHFYKKFNGFWYPLKDHNYALLLDEMLSTESTLDLNNFTDSNVIVTDFVYQRRQYLMARRLSKIRCVKFDTQELWKSTTKEFFKNAFLSFDKNGLVLIKMTLCEPNFTYFRFDLLSPKYCSERLLFFTVLGGTEWRLIAEDEYTRLLEDLDNDLTREKTWTQTTTFDFQNGDTNRLFFTKSHYTSPVDVEVYEPQASRIDEVKDGSKTFWKAKDSNSYCKDLYLYNLGSEKVLDLYIFEGKPHHLLFVKKESVWTRLSLDEYQHMLHIPEIPVQLDLTNTNFEYLAMVKYNDDGVPTTEFKVNSGYYFYQVKDEGETLWETARLHKCTKVFQVNMSGYNVVSLLVEDPLTNKSHQLFYQKKPTGWKEVTQSFYKSVLITVELSTSFTFDLADFVFSYASSFEPSYQSEEKFSIFKYKFTSLPMVTVNPNHNHNLTKLTEGSEEIWSRQKGSRLHSLSFNHSHHPILLRLLLLSKDSLQKLFFYRCHGKWEEITDSQFYNHVRTLEQNQLVNNFKFNLSKVEPSNQFTYKVYNANPETATLLVNEGYQLTHLTDNDQTIWENKDDSKLYSLSYTPLDRPKFLFLLLSKDFKFFPKYFVYEQNFSGNYEWMNFDSRSYYRKLTEFREAYYADQEILELVDVANGEQKEYYNFEESQNVGLVKLKEPMANIAVFFNRFSVHTPKSGQKLKQVLFAPLENPQVLRLDFVKESKMSEKDVFVSTEESNLEKEVRKYFVKEDNWFKQCKEDNFLKEYQELQKLSNTTQLDLSVFYQLSEEYYKRPLESMLNEELSSYVTKEMEKNYQNPATQPFEWAVFNYRGLDIMSLELNPNFVLTQVRDGNNFLCSLHYSEKVKMYFTLRGTKCFVLYNEKLGLKEKSLLFYEKLDKWSLVQPNFSKELSILEDLVTKPLSVDLFHLVEDTNPSIKLFPNPMGVEYTTVRPEVGYHLKSVYYDSELLYTTVNQTDPELKDFQKVDFVTFYPRMKPRLIKLVVDQKSSKINYYKVVDDDGEGTRKFTFKSLTIFEYFTELDKLGPKYEFSLDVEAPTFNDYYSLSKEGMFPCEYTVVTPREGRDLALLKKGSYKIWEPEEGEKVQTVLIFKHQKQLVLVNYLDKNNEENFKFFQKLKSQDDWIEVPQQTVFDLLNLSPESKSFDFELNNLVHDFKRYNYKTIIDPNCRLNVKRLYGSDFAVVTPKFKRNLNQVKDKGQVIFDTKLTTNQQDNQSLMENFGKRVTKVLAGPYDNPKLLRITYLNNFQTVHDYFKKNENNLWEQVTNVEFGKGLWLLKRFNLAPVDLILDDPNPSLFTSEEVLKNNVKRTLITPNEKYTIKKVVSLERDEYDKLLEDKYSFVLEQNVLEVELVQNSLRLLRFSYTEEREPLEVKKQYFVLKYGKYEKINENEFNRLLWLTKTSLKPEKYELDIFMRVFFCENLESQKGYEEVKETVFDHQVLFVFPKAGSHLDQLTYNNDLVYKCGDYEVGQELALYPPDSPEVVMFKSINRLDNTVKTQYFNLIKVGKDQEKMWVKGEVKENDRFDQNADQIMYDLAVDKTHESLIKFTYTKEHVPTTVVLPRKGVQVEAIYYNYTLIWSPETENDEKEELVKFYYAPSLLVVLYRDLDGIVRLKDYVKSHFKWQENYSKFISDYKLMLSSSYKFNLSREIDLDKITVKEFLLHGFTVRAIFPNTNTKVLALSVDYEDKEKLLWNVKTQEVLYTAQFAPADNPKVLLLSHSEPNSILSTTLFYRDPQLGWTKGQSSCYSDFSAKLLELENSFVYYVRQKNPELPSEDYTYEYTELFKVKFASISPKNKRNMVSILDFESKIYERKPDEHILDLLLSPPENPQFAIVLSTSQYGGTKTRYYSSSGFWTQLTYGKFLLELRNKFSNHWVPSPMNSEEAYGKLLYKLSKGTGDSKYLDEEVLLQKEYKNFTLDLNDTKETEFLTSKQYVESTLERTVLRVKRGNLLSKLKQGEEEIWDLETFLNQNYPKKYEEGEVKDLLTTHVYFAPSNDPKVLTLFLKPNKLNIKSLRFVKNEKWTRFYFGSEDLTNEVMLLTLTNKKSLDLDKECRHPSNSLYKKEIVTENAINFLEISPQDPENSSNIVKISQGSFTLWEKSNNEDFVSIVVYPVLSPKFAELRVKGPSDENKYFKKYATSWFQMTEVAYHDLLDSFTHHQSEDFLQLDLSELEKLQKSSSLVSHFRTIHKLDFQSVTPTNYKKISSVVTRNHKESEENKAKEKKVIFEATPNEEIEMVSFTPSQDPKLLLVILRTTNTSEQLSDANYNSSANIVRELKLNQRTDSFFTTSSTMYYKEGDEWIFADAATFKEKCLKLADELAKRTTPFDLDLDKPEFNEDKYQVTNEGLGGVYFTKISPSEGYAIAHVYKSNRMVFKRSSFPIDSLSLFPRSSAKFIKLTLEMSKTLKNNYYFVSYDSLGLMKKDYLSFKTELINYLHKQTSQSAKSEDKTEHSQTKELEKSTGLLLFGYKERLKGEEVEEFIYYVDPENNSTSAVNYDEGSTIKEYEDAFKTFSGEFFNFSYYLVVPNSDFIPTRLYNKTDLLLDTNFVNKINAVLTLPRDNPSFLLCSHTTPDNDRSWTLFTLLGNQWFHSNNTIMRHKMKNIAKFHLVDLFPELCERPTEDFGFVFNDQSPIVLKSPEKTNDIYVLEGFIVNPEEKENELNNEFDPQFKYRYDLLENKLLSHYSVKDFQLYHEEERGRTLILVDDHFKGVTLEFNDLVLLDLTKPDVASQLEFNYDISIDNGESPNFKVQLKSFLDYEYKLVTVPEGSNVKEVFDGDELLWKSGDRKVKSFVYYPADYPSNFFVSFRKGDTDDYEYLNKEGVKWVNYEKTSPLLNLEPPLHPESNSEKPNNDREIKGIILSPSNNPNKIHVMYNQNGTSKYASYSKEGNKYEPYKMSLDELISAKISFITAKINSESLLIEGEYSFAQDLNTGKNLKKTVRLLPDSLSINLLFFTYRPDLQNQVYLPINNFKPKKVSYGMKTLYKLNEEYTKEAYAFHLKYEDPKGTQPSRITVFMRSFSDGRTRYTYKKNDKNEWIMTNLPSEELLTILKQVRNARELCPKRTPLSTTVQEKTFENYSSFTPKKGLSLTGSVKSDDIEGFNIKTFFTYDLEQDEMDIFVRKLETKFYTYKTEGFWHNYKVVLVDDAYNAVLLKSGEEVLLDTTKMEDNEVIEGVYMRPPRAPKVLYVYLKNEFGKELFKSYKKTKLGDGEKWMESPIGQNSLSYARSKFDQVSLKKESLRLSFYDYSLMVHTGESFTTYKRLRKFDYYVDTDSVFPKFPYNSAFSDVNLEEDYKVLVPFRHAKISQVSQGKENLFSLPSQFHKVHALLLSPISKPESVVVYHTDDQGNEKYTALSKLKLPFVKSELFNEKSPQETLFNQPSKTWYEVNLDLTELEDLMNKIHKSLSIYDSLYPNAVTKAERREGYNLDVYLTGTFKERRDNELVSRSFVYFYEPERPNSVYVFEDEKVLEYKDAFQVSTNDSNFANYLSIRPREQYQVTSVVQGDQEIMTFGSNNTLLSLLLTPFQNPKSLFVSVRWSDRTEAYYYYVKRNNSWINPSSVEQEFFKLKLYNAQEAQKTKTTPEYNLELYLTGLNLDEKHETQEFVYFYTEQSQTSVYVVCGDKVVEKKHAFEVVKGFAAFKFMTFKPKLPTYVVTSVVVSDQELMKVDEHSLLTSVSVYPSSKPTKVMVTLKDLSGQTNYFYSYANGKWNSSDYLTQFDKRPLLYPSDKVNEYKELSTNEFEDRKTYSFELHLSGYTLESKDNHLLASRSFVYFYEPERPNSVYVFEDEKVLEYKDAFDVSTGENFYLSAKPTSTLSFFTDSVTYADQELLKFDNCTYFLSLTVLPLKEPLYLDVLSVTLSRSFKNHVFKRMDHKWKLLDPTSQEYKKYYKTKQLLLDPLVYDKELLEKATEKSGEEFLDFLLNNTRKVACTKFSFDLLKDKESTKDYTYKKQTYRGLDYVTVQVTRDTVLEKLLEGGSLVWNNDKSVFVRYLLFFTADNPSHLALVFKGGMLGYKYMYKYQGTWQEVVFPEKAQSLLRQLTEEREFQLDISKQNETNENYQLEVQTIQGQEIVIAKIEHRSKLKRVVDGSELVWELEEQEAKKVVYHPKERPEFVGMELRNYLNKPVYVVYQKLEGKWLVTDKMTQQVIKTLMMLAPSETEVEKNPFELDLNVENKSTKDYNLQFKTVQGYNLVVGLVSKESNLVKVVDSQLLVWENPGDSTVSKFVYSPPTKPSVFGLLRSNDKFENQTLTFVKKSGRWVPFSQGPEAEVLLSTLVQENVLEVKDFAFDLSYASEDTYSDSCQRQLNLYDDLFFRSIKPKEGFRITEVTDSFTVVYYNKEEEIEEVSYYPFNDPQLLLVKTSQSLFPLEFVKSEGKWVDNIQLFKYKVKEYTTEQAKSCQIDLGKLSEQETSDKSKDYTLLKERMSETTQVLSVTPRKGVELKSVKEGKELIWKAEEDDVAQTFTLFPTNNPNLLSVYTLKNGVKYYSKSQGQWKEVTKQAFEYMTSYYRGADTSLDLSGVVYFQRAHKTVLKDFNETTKFKSSMVQITTRFKGLSTAILKTGEKLFGLVLARFNSKGLYSSLKYKNTEIHEFKNERFNSAYFYPFENPYLLLLRTRNDENKMTERYFMRLLPNTEGTKWEEIDMEEYYNLVLLINRPEYVYTLYKTEDKEKEEEKGFDFDISNRNLDREEFLLRKLSTKRSRYMLLVKKGYKLNKVYYEQELLFEPREKEKILDLYYSLDPLNMFLSVKLLTKDENGQETLSFVTFKKMITHWVGKPRVSQKFPKGDHLMKLFESEVKEFAFDLGLRKQKEGYELKTLHELKTLPDLDGTLLQVNEGYYLTELFYNGQSFYEVPQNHQVTSLYFSPNINPTHLTIKYEEVTDDGTKLSVCSYWTRGERWQRRRLYKTLPDNLSEPLEPKKEQPTDYEDFLNYEEDYSTKTISEYSDHSDKEAGDQDESVSHSVTTYKESVLETKYNEFELDLETVFEYLTKEEEGMQFTVTEKRLNGYTFLLVVPSIYSRMAKLKEGSELVWLPRPDIRVRTLSYRKEDPKLVMLAYSRLQSPNEYLKKYFVNSQGWNEVSLQEYSKLVQPQQEVKLDISSMLNSLFNSLGFIVNESGKVELTQKSFFTLSNYYVPTYLNVKSLYDRSEKIHEQETGTMDSIQLSVNSTDVFLVLTTTEDDNQRRHFYHTSLVEDEKYPLECYQFKYDLSREHKTNKYYKVKHKKVKGLHTVLVRVRKHNKLTKLVDGDLVLWTQHNHKYATNLAYLPENKPTHLCLGVYDLDEHKVRYRFFYKSVGKWYRYHERYGLPYVLQAVSNEFFSTRFLLDLSGFEQDSWKYEFTSFPFHDFEVAVVKPLKDHTLAKVTYEGNTLWSSSEFMYVNKILYYPKENPHHLWVSFHMLGDNYERYQFVVKKVEGWTFEIDPRHTDLFSFKFAQSSSNYFSNNTKLTHDQPKLLYENLPDEELSKRSYSLQFEYKEPLDDQFEVVVSCTKFDFDLSMENHSNEHYDLSTFSTPKRNYVFGTVKCHNFLMRVVDGEQVVWTNNGHQLVKSFLYSPSTKPDLFFLRAQCLKSKREYQRAYFKHGGKWHEKEEEDKEVSELLDKAEVFKFDFNLSAESNDEGDYEKQTKNNEVLVRLFEKSDVEKVLDGEEVVWTNDGNKEVKKLVYWPEEDPTNLALYYSDNDVPTYQFLKKVQDKWEDSEVTSVVKEKFKWEPKRLGEALVQRTWTKVDSTYFHNFAHLPRIMKEISMDLSKSQDEGYYEVKKGFDYKLPITVYNPLPSSFLLSLSEGNQVIWMTKQLNVHAKSVLTVYEFSWGKEKIVAEPKLLQVYVKNKEIIRALYFSKTQEQKWKEVEEPEYLELYKNIAESKENIEMLEKMLANERNKNLNKDEFDLNIFSHEDNTRYNVETVNVMGEEHVFFTVKGQNKVSSLREGKIPIASFEGHKCVGLFYYPKLSPQEVIVRTRGKRGLLNKPQYYKKAGKWVLGTLPNTVRINKAINQLDVLLEEEPIEEVFKEDKVEEFKEDREELEVTTEFNPKDPLTDLVENRKVQNKLNGKLPTTLFKIRMNESENVYLPFLDQKVTKVQLGNFVFYQHEGPFEDETVVAVTTKLGENNELEKVTVTLQEGSEFKHLFYVFDKQWKNLPLSKQELEELTENVQYGQNKLYSDTFKRKYFTV